MHMAAQNEHSCKEVVSLLLKEGARVDTVDNVSVYANKFTRRSCQLMLKCWTNCC